MLGLATVDGAGEGVATSGKFFGETADAVLIAPIPILKSKSNVLMQKKFIIF